MKSNLLVLAFLSLVLTACASSSVGQTPSAFDAPLSSQPSPKENELGQKSAPTLPPQASDRMRVMLVPSEVVIGPNRFAVGLFDLNGQMINNALVHFQYFDLSNPGAPRLESEANATHFQSPDGRTTIFAHERRFDRDGNWGVAVQALFPDGFLATERIGFQVLATSPTLKVGQQAPRIDTPVAGEMNNDLSRLTSATEPNPAFYQLSLAQVLRTGKPTVLLLATPAFCQSRLCGPAYDVTSGLQKRYADRLNFVHVEVYTGLPTPVANNWQLAPAMQAFGLETEPWLYLIGKGGTVVYRVEGLFTADEIASQIQALLDSS